MEYVLIAFWLVFMFYCMEHGFRAGAERRGFKYIAATLGVVLGANAVTVLVIT